MTEENLNHIVYSASVIEFATIANEYCNFIENNQSFSREQFFDKLQKLLPLLYYKVSLLPEVDDEDVDTPEKVVTEVDYNFLLNRLSSKLGAFDSYLEVFDPGMQFSESPVEASIAENLCDIYQDLKDFIFAYRMGTTEIMTDALWECRNNFREYWGQKLVNGLRAIHSHIFSENDLNGEDDHVSSRDISDHKGSNWVSKHFNNYSDEEDFLNNDL